MVNIFPFGNCPNKINSTLLLYRHPNKDLPDHLKCVPTGEISTDWNYPLLTNMIFFPEPYPNKISLLGVLIHKRYRNPYGDISGVSLYRKKPWHLLINYRLVPKRPQWQELIGWRRSFSFTKPSQNILCSVGLPSRFFQNIITAEVYVITAIGILLRT